MSALETLFNAYQLIFSSSYITFCVYLVVFTVIVTLVRKFVRW